MSIPPVMTFGKWLKAERRAQDLTQVELARRVYCAEITIRKIEADQLRPSRRLVYLLLNALEIPHAQQDDLLRLARRTPRKGEPAQNIE